MENRKTGLSAVTHSQPELLVSALGLRVRRSRGAACDPQCKVKFSYVGFKASLGCCRPGSKPKAVGWGAGEQILNSSVTGGA